MTGIPLTNVMATVGRQEGSDGDRVGGCVQGKEQVEADRQCEDAAQQIPADVGECDVPPEQGNTIDLHRDGRDQHDLHDGDLVAHDLEEKSRREGREGKANGARSRRCHENYGQSHREGQE
jgi:hypothetical protein